MSLAALPSDILLTIATYLSTPDILALLSVNTSLRTLSTFRSLWISLLTRTPSIACHPALSLAHTPLPKLKSIAHTTHRLHTNWVRPVPQIARAIKARQFGSALGAARILGAVPGAGVVLLYFPEERALACVDVDGTGAPVTLELGGVLKMHQCKSVGEGTHLLATITFDGDDESPSPVHKEELHIVLITHAPGKPPAMRTVFRELLDYACGELFLLGDVVGLVLKAPEGEAPAPVLVVHAINFVTGMRKNIRIDLAVPIPKHAYINCFSPDSPASICAVHIVVSHAEQPASGEQHLVYHLPGDVLPFSEPIASDDPTNGISTLPGSDTCTFSTPSATSTPTISLSLSLSPTIHAAPTPTDSDPAALMGLRHSPAGVVTLSAVLHGEYRQLSSTRVYFWPSGGECSMGVGEETEEPTCVDEVDHTHAPRVDPSSRTRTSGPQTFLLPAKPALFHTHARDSETEYLLSPGVAHTLVVLDRAGDVGSRAGIGWDAHGNVVRFDEPEELDPELNWRWDDEHERALYVVHYALEDKGVLARRLVLPSFVDLREVTSIGMDWRFGVVYLAHREGYLFAVGYV